MTKIYRIVALTLLALLLIDVYLSSFVGLGYGIAQGLVFLIICAVLDFFIAAFLLLYLTLKSERDKRKGGKGGSNR